MILTDIMIIIIAFIGIWTGATLAVKPIDEIAKKLNRSSFIVSFFILGMFTSLTEVSVAFNSYMDGNVEISVGNLLGGSLVLLLFVIPILGILSKGIQLNNKFGIRNTFLAILYLLVPHFFLLDKKLSVFESLLLLLLYVVLAMILFFSDKKEKPVLHLKKRVRIKRTKFAFAFFLVTVGSVILIFSSNILVESIDKLGSTLSLSPFVLALVGLSISTNLPEISLAIVSSIKGNSEVGFGSYLGSAIFNPFILAILGLVSRGMVINENFSILFIFSFVGFLLFSLFIRSKNFLTTKESSILLVIYFLFVLIELIS